MRRTFNVFVNFGQRTTKTSSRPTAKRSNPFSPLVVLTIERLLLCRLSMSLGFRCSAFCTLVQLIHASKDLLQLRQSSTSPALSALTTARQSRSHQSTYRGSATTGEFQQIKCCGSDKMPFSSTRIESKQLVMRTRVNARANCAVTRNTVHQGSSSCSPPAH